MASKPSRFNDIAGPPARPARQALSDSSLGTGSDGLVAKFYTYLEPTPTRFGAGYAFRGVSHSQRARRPGILLRREDAADQRLQHGEHALNPKAREKRHA